MPLSPRTKRLLQPAVVLAISLVAFLLPLVLIPRSTLIDDFFYDTFYRLRPQQDMTLGMMIYWALSYSAILQNLWWWWMPPVALLIVLFMALYLVHLGLDEVSNPRLRAAN